MSMQDSRSRETNDEWLDPFEIFAMDAILREIPTLWKDNLFTDVKATKLRQAERELTTPLFLLRYMRAGSLFRISICSALVLSWTSGRNEIHHPWISVCFRGKKTLRKSKELRRIRMLLQMY